MQCHAGGERERERARKRERERERERGGGGDDADARHTALVEEENVCDCTGLRQ